MTEAVCTDSPLHTGAGKWAEGRGGVRLARGMAGHHRIDGDRVGKKHCHCHIRSGPPVRPSTSKCLKCWRLAAMRHNRKLLTHCHSIALAAESALTQQRPRPAASSFSFPSLLLRASFTVSGLKTSSPSPRSTFLSLSEWFHGSVDGGKGRGRQGGRQRASGRQGRRRQGSSV